jgi:amidase
LTEIFFDQALTRAKELDEYFANNRTPVGPLHGLPISLKDSFNVVGVHATIGYVSYAKRPPATINSATVEILLRQGAVMYDFNLPRQIADSWLF